jgi:arginine decarboxylase
MLIPSKFFLTNGVGKHKDKLTSFEMALRHAKIAPYNLVRVSSIKPPNCVMVTKDAGVKMMTPGQIIFCVMSDNSTNEPHRLISASCGIAIPKDVSHYGYISEYHCEGKTEKEAGNYAEDIAAGMLATTLGYDFDPNLSWDAKKEQWKIDGKMFKSRNVTQSATGDKNGLWTTVVSAVVFCDY